MATLAQAPLGYPRLLIAARPLWRATNQPENRALNAFDAALVWCGSLIRQLGPLVAAGWRRFFDRCDFVHEDPSCRACGSLFAPVGGTERRGRGSAAWVREPDPRLPSFDFSLQPVEEPAAPPGRMANLSPNRGSTECRGHQSCRSFRRAAH
jgi:hypothetical protein